MKVICRRSHDYNFTEGKEYEVIELCPQLICENYTFPRYIVVLDDNGKKAISHATRFKTLEGTCCDDYIKEQYKDIRSA